jgi:hypothetical protein
LGRASYLLGGLVLDKEKIRPKLKENIISSEFMNREKMFFDLRDT